MEQRQTVRVRGDWLPEEHQGYEAQVDAEHWNGWAVPRFTLEVARQVVADQAALDAKLVAEGYSDALDSITEEADPIRFVMVNADYPEDAPMIVEADDDGLFAIGGWMWCWYEVEEASVGGQA